MRHTGPRRGAQLDDSPLREEQRDLDSGESNHKRNRRNGYDHNPRGGPGGDPGFHGLTVHGRVCSCVSPLSSPQLGGHSLSFWYKGGRGGRGFHSRMGKISSTWTASPSL